MIEEQDRKTQRLSITGEHNRTQLESIAENAGPRSRMGKAADGDIGEPWAHSLEEGDEDPGEPQVEAQTQEP